MRLKEELELTKEQVLKLQKASLERDVYKSLGDENLRLKGKIADLEAQGQKRVLEMRAL